MKSVDRKKSKSFELLPLLILGVLLVLAFQLRFQGTQIRHPLTFDETLYAWMGEHLIYKPGDYSSKELHDLVVSQGQRFPKSASRYLTAPLFKHPPMFCYILREVRRATGDLQKVKLVPPFMSCLVILFGFLIARSAYGILAGWLAAVFLFLDPNLWICGQKVWMESTLTAFIMAALFFFIKALSTKKSKQPRWFICTGAAVGIACLTKYPAFIIFVGMFIYLIFFDRGIFRKRWLWAMPVLVAMIMMPWFSKNIQVYGMSGFLNEFSNVMIYAKSGRFLLFAALGIVVALVPMGITALQFLIKGNEEKQKPDEKSGFASRKPKSIYGYALFGIILFGALLTVPAFRAGLISSFALTDVPSGSFVIGFFKDRAWSFYMTRSIRLSLFYIPAYAIFFLPWVQKRNFIKTDLVLLTPALLFMAGLVLWKNYQSRYALPCTSILLVLGARMMAALWEKVANVPNNAQRVTFKTIWIAFLLFSTVKTILVDIRFVMPNDMAYY